VLQKEKLELLNIVKDKDAAIADLKKKLNESKGVVQN